MILHSCHNPTFGWDISR